MPWRLILALFVGTAGVLFGLSILLLMDSPTSSLVRTSQFGLIALCGASALLAYPLWAGRYWALLALRFLVLLTVVPVVVLSIADFGHAQGGLSTNLGDLAFYGSLFTIPMFVLAVLFHPNVIQEFRHQNVSGS